MAKVRNADYIEGNRTICSVNIIVDDRGEECLTTEGVNIDAMFQHENILDLNKLYCNNIHEMSRYYGVEAAAKTIVREICTVFKPYGIDVDKRHLTLIGDYMTFDGTYKPFNRIGETSLNVTFIGKSTILQEEHGYFSNTIA